MYFTVYEYKYYVYSSQGILCVFHNVMTIDQSYSDLSMCVNISHSSMNIDILHFVRTWLIHVCVSQFYEYK